VTVIGLIADTHCNTADRLDLPSQALDALVGCDLIVHLGDLTSVGVLDRLATTAGEIIGIRNPRRDPPAGVDHRLIDGPLNRTIGRWKMALCRAYPCNDIDTDVDLIAYGVPADGGGHDYRVAVEGRRLLVSPGSPNLAVRTNTVARVGVTAASIEVDIVHL
jgi:predicted phosphodiesterase